MSIDLSFDTQMMLWGYAIGGNDWLEFSALISENPRPSWIDSRGESVPWDDPKQLVGVRRFYGDEELPIPEKWACWWIGEHERRAS